MDKRKKFLERERLPITCAKYTKRINKKHAKKHFWAKNTKLVSRSARGVEKSFEKNYTTSKNEGGNKMNQKVENLKGKLIVSCQALPDEPLHSSFIMGRMALAAKVGGASGIRANTKEDI